MRKVSDIAAVADAELVGRTAGGDEAAFGELLSRYQGQVYGYARRMLGDESLAEDVAQVRRFYVCTAMRSGFAPGALSGAICCGYAGTFVWIICEPKD